MCSQAALAPRLTHPGMDAKAASRISTLDFSRRSPDLNVLDYSLWRAINARVRKRELAVAAGKRESQEEREARLRKVALSMPASVVTRAIKDVARRVHALRVATGRLIRERGAREPANWRVRCVRPAG